MLYLSNELTGEDDAIYSSQAGGGILPQCRSTLSDVAYAPNYRTV